jgi:peptide/nickel transport system permease protein
MTAVDVDRPDAKLRPGASLAATPPSGPVWSRRAGRRVWMRRLTLWVPLAAVIIVLFFCYVWPLFGMVPPPTGGNVLESNLPSFSRGHLLGTDPNGNDVVSRLLYGGRSSLYIALVVNLLGFAIGGGLGALCGLVGGRFDTVVMRLLDILIAFPSLVLTLAIAQSLGPSIGHTIFALTFFSVPAFARIARSAVLRLRELPFMTAAELCGSPRWRIMARHVAPNIGPQLVSFALLGIGTIIVLEGALSFLGLGIPPPAPSWGNMIFDGNQSLTATPTLVVWPSLALLLSALSFNLLGENLRSLWSSR